MYCQPATLSCNGIVFWNDHSYHARMSLGRPVTFDVDKVIEQATQVFWSQGYTATSMADLLAATRLSRSSLYQTFSGKQALFKRCLQYYCNDFAGQLESNLKQAKGGREFIEQTFMDMARKADDPMIQRGCFAMNTAMELGHTRSPLAREVHKGLKRFTAIFEDAVKQAQQEGTISANRNASDLANYLVSSMCGLRMLIKCGLPPAEIRHVAEQILRALD